MTIERYKYTDIECEECGDRVVMDIFKGEFYCLNCGLLHGVYYVSPTDTGPIQLD